MTASVNRSIWIRERQIRVTIQIDGAHYKLHGHHAPERGPDDEEVRRMADLFRIYEQYGIVEPGTASEAEAVAPAASAIAPVIKRMPPLLRRVLRIPPDNWNREGICYDWR
jgi:hypothetical protein